MSTSAYPSSSAEAGSKNSGCSATSASSAGIRDGIPVIRRECRLRRIDLRRLEYILGEETCRATLRHALFSAASVIVRPKGATGTARVFAERNEGSMCSALICLRRQIDRALDPYYLIYVQNSAFGEDTRTRLLATGLRATIEYWHDLVMELPCPPVRRSVRSRPSYRAYDDLIETNNRRIRLLRRWPSASTASGSSTSAIQDTNIQLVDSALGSIPQGGRVRHNQTMIDINAQTGTSVTRRSIRYIEAAR